MSPSVAVVIVAWNNYADTHECLESILAQKQVETSVFLVDNGSKTEPLVNLVMEYPGINYIHSETNLGFAAGTNLGLREALKTGAEYILIVNNDTRADESMVNELLMAAESEHVGLTAPLIYYYDAPDKIWSSGGRINELLLMPLDSHNRLNPVSVPTKRTFLSGCCYLLKKEMLTQVGLFDERFFLYFEDLDFCMRVKDSNWKMTVVPTAKLLHKVSMSSGGSFSESERYQYARSSGIYFRKYLNPVNTLPVLLFRLGSAIATSFRLLRQKKNRALKGYWKGLFEGWFSKLIDNSRQ